MDKLDFINTAEEARFVLQMLNDPKKAKVLELFGWNLQELHGRCKEVIKTSPPQEIIEAARQISTWFARHGITNGQLGVFAPVIIPDSKRKRIQDREHKIGDYEHGTMKILRHRELPITACGMTVEIHGNHHLDGERLTMVEVDMDDGSIKLAFVSNARDAPVTNPVRL